MKALRPVPSRPLTRILPASISGVILGHVFLYSLLFGTASHLHTDIAITNHSYLPLMTSMGTALLLLSAWWHWRAGRSLHSGTSKASFTHTFAVLFIVQSLVFIGMEIGEQYVSGGNHAVGHLLASSFLVYGCAFQLLTACLVAALITGAESLGAYIAARKVVAITSRSISRHAPLLELGRFDIHFSIRAPPASPRSITN